MAIYFGPASHGPGLLRLFETNPEPDRTVTKVRKAPPSTLLGQINDNDPTRMLYQGSNVFRPEAASAFVITFTVEGDRATRLSIVSPDGTMEGVRVDGEERDRSPDVPPDPSRSGALYDELARMDSVLFDAAFVTCDAAKINSLLNDDIEFYHDQTGFSSGQEVRRDFQRLTQNCPRDNGIARRLVVGSLQVYPMKDDYVIQMGAHRFVEEGRQTSTIARFVHLWQKKGKAWRLARVLSFDHRVEKSAASLNYD